MDIFPSKRNAIRKEVKREKISAIWRFASTPTSMAPTAKGIAYTFASAGKRGKARLIASATNIPARTNRIWRKAVVLKNTRSIVLPAGKPGR